MGPLPMPMHGIVESMNESDANGNLARPEGDEPCATRTWVHRMLFWMTVVSAGLLVASAVWLTFFILALAGFLTAGIGYALAEPVAKGVLKNRALRALGARLESAGYSREAPHPHGPEAEADAPQTLVCWRHPDREGTVLWGGFVDGDLAAGSVALALNSRMSPPWCWGFEAEDVVGPEIRIASPPTGESTFRVGDPQFDARYEAAGPEAALRALLGLEERAALLALTGTVEVENGRLVARQADVDAEVETSIARARAAAVQLRQASAADVDLRLVVNAGSVEDHAAMIAHVECLLTRSGQSPDLEASAREIAQGHPWLELALAVHLANADDARHQLHEVASIAVDVMSAGMMALIESACRLVFGQFCPDEVGDITSALLAHSAARFPALTAILDCRPSYDEVALPSLLDPPTVRDFLWVVPNDDAVELLERSRDPRAEQALLALLDVPTGKTAALAAEALGRLGTTVALNQLEALITAGSLPYVVRRSASDATDLIRSRKDRERRRSYEERGGGLSLVESSNKGGGLSLVEPGNKAGGLTVMPDKGSADIRQKTDGRDDR